MEERGGLGVRERERGFPEAQGAHLGLCCERKVCCRYFFFLNVAIKMDKSCY